MDDASVSESGNRYCSRLGLPVPDLQAAARFSGVKLCHLMALALLEAGGPLTLDEIAERLGRLALPPRLAPSDLHAALRKAWHGQPPIVRDPSDGRFYLDLLAHSELFLLAFTCDLRKPLVAPAPVEEPCQPPDSVPLSEAEVNAAFTRRSLDTYSSIRRAAAILEVAGGGPMSVDDVNQRLKAFGRWTGRIQEAGIQPWRSDLVQILPDGMLRLNPSSADVAALRRDIRRMALPALRLAARGQAFKAQHEEYERAREQEQRLEMADAHKARRALLHVVVLDGVPRAAATIDVRTRELRLFTGEQVRDLPALLAEFDLLAGVDLRSALRSLAVNPDRWWLADLRPTQRTFRPSGLKAIPITMRAIVQATTGRRGIPAEADRWEKLVSSSSTARLESGLAAEARALLEFYEYGALHGAVRVRTRPGDDRLPVAWSLPGDPHFHAIIDAAARAWTPVELVIGAPPALADPWASAITATVVEQDRETLFVREGETLRPLARADIHAIRIPDGAAAATIRPGVTSRHDTRTCRLTVTLDEIAPPIWRRLEVPASMTLAKLHAVLQVALGWTDSHLHTFEIGPERVAIPYSLDDLTEGGTTRSARLVRLGEVVDHGHRRFAYAYDFGDSWRHTIEIEDLHEADGSSEVRCLAGARACPPEDCGGTPGYEELLEVLFDPLHPEFEESRTWVGSAFDPERFDLRAVNAALARIPHW